MENIRKLTFPNVNMVKEIIIRFVQNQNDKLKGYLSMERSLGHLMEIAKDFYYISTGINEINEGVKNAKRFKITILHLIYFSIFTFIISLFIASNYLYSLLYVHFLPVQFRFFLLYVSLASSWILVIKIDMILAEIKLNLSPLKVFYFLINNIKSKHKLIDLNFNRLAFFISNQSTWNYVLWSTDCSSNFNGVNCFNCNFISKNHLDFAHDLFFDTRFANDYCFLTLDVH